MSTYKSTTVSLKWDKEDSKNKSIRERFTSKNEVSEEEIIEFSKQNNNVTVYYRIESDIGYTECIYRDGVQVSATHYNQLLPWRVFIKDTSLDKESVKAYLNDMLVDEASDADTFDEFYDECIESEFSELEENNLYVNNFSKEDLKACLRDFYDNIER